MNKLVLGLAVSIVCIACGGGGSSSSGGSTSSSSSSSSSSNSGGQQGVFKDPLFIPPEGQRVNVVGQNNDTIAEYVSEIGVPPGGVTAYLGLAAVDTFGQFDSLNGTANWGSGDVNIPQLATLYPDSVMHIGLSVVDQLPNVINGTLDTKILSLFNKLTALDVPVLLRWGYEADGDGWNDYDPDQFKQAWVRAFEILHGDRLVAGEVVDPLARDRIAMVFQVAASCFSLNTPATSTAYADHIEQWYPGSEYVDWFSFSYFTPITCGTEYIEGAIEFANRPEVDRPIMISESTPQGFMMGNDNNLGQPNYNTPFANLGYNPQVSGVSLSSRTGEDIYNEWFVDYRNFIAANAVRYVAYIADDWDKLPMWGAPYSAGYWGDGELWENDYIETKWREDMIDNPNVLNASNTLFCQLGYEAC